MKDQDVQAILREIVNDLQNTTAILDYLVAEVGVLSPKAVAEKKDRIGLAAQSNKKFMIRFAKKLKH